MKSKTGLILLISILLINVVCAETLIVGVDDADAVFNTTQENKTEIVPTLTDELTDVLKDIRATTDEKKYLEAINERSDKLERQYDDVLSTLESTNRDQLHVIQRQNEQLSDIQEELTESKETLNSQIVEMEIQLQRQELYKYIFIILTMIFTVFIMEYIQGLTRRKKIFFKLRKVRDEIPINVGLIVGSDRRGGEN